MTSMTTQMLTSLSAHTTYLAVTFVLAGLIMISLWQGRSALGRVGVFRLFAALVLLGSARTWLLLEKGSVMPDTESWATFAVLNLAGFVLLADFAIQMMRGDEGAKRNEKFLLTHDEVMPFQMKGRRATAYFAAFGAFVYLVRWPAPGVGTMMVGIAGASAVGATVPALITMIRSVSRAPDALKRALWVATGAVSASWILSLVGSMSANDVFTIAARCADGAALFVVLGTIVSNYIRLGMESMMRASEREREHDEAQTEIQKLNQITSSLYEDSSDLIQKQNEQTLQFMRRVESLEKILEIGITIQRRQRLEDVLQRVVEVIRDNLGFRTVTLRLFNDRSQSFETRAHVGLGDDVRDTVLNYRIPLGEYQKMIEPRFRISNSYFIRKNASWLGEELEENDKAFVEDTWREIEMLLVPLADEENQPVGYLSVENPEDLHLSVRETIESLENVASLAVIAIRNARFFAELKAKNEKLRVYAEKLSSLNKLKSNFVATISHEFRTPLTSIRAYCDTLLRNSDSVDRDLLKQFLIVIDEESSRLMTLIEDILDFSQMESGAVRLQRSLSDLKEIAELSISELKKNFDSKKITLHRRFPDEAVSLQCENELIKQLMVNLLHNAAKFTKPGGNVTLVIEEESACVRIIVEDDGIGVPEDQLETIFEQFHQADGSSTRQHNGSGLGLAICRNIVEWHEGRIWVESVHGRGARFVAVIPRRYVVAKYPVAAGEHSVRRFEADRMLELLIENVADLMSVRKASLMLLEPDRKTLRMVSAVGVDEDTLRNAQVRVGEGIAGRVAESGDSMLVTDIEQDDRTNRSNNDSTYGSGSFICVPVRVGSTIAGVINVASSMQKDEFDNDDRQLLETVAERVGVAMAKLEAFTKQSMTYERVRELFTAMLEARRYIDRQGDEWLDRVIMRAAKQFGIQGAALHELRYIMHIYDLGLSRVGYHIIKKPRELSNKDREQMQAHAETGPEMLAAVETNTRVEEIVRSHHENFDGSGYPNGASGEDIPLAARIIRVADSLRAMISHRPYQQRFTLEEATSIIRQRSGTHFDPKVVDAFMVALEQVGPTLRMADRSSRTSSSGTTTAEKPSPER